MNEMQAYRNAIADRKHASFFPKKNGPNVVAGNCRCDDVVTQRKNRLDFRRLEKVSWFSPVVRCFFFWGGGVYFFDGGVDISIAFEHKERWRQKKPVADGGSGYRFQSVALEKADAPFFLSIPIEIGPPIRRTARRGAHQHIGAVIDSFIRHHRCQTFPPPTHPLPLPDSDKRSRLTSFHQVTK